LERQEDEPVSGSDCSDTPVEYPDDQSPIKAMRKAKKKVLFHFIDWSSGYSTGVSEQSEPETGSSF